MGEFGKWILHENQKDVFNIFFATILTLVFLALCALALWPLGQLDLAWRLAKGIWIFWIALVIACYSLAIIHRLLRIDMDSHFDAFVISSLLVSGFVLSGWSAFAALAVGEAAAGLSWARAGALHLAGFLSSFVACNVVSAYYNGSLYRTVNTPLFAVSYVIFALWPAGGRFLYGWFFGLF